MNLLVLVVRAGPVAKMTLLLLIIISIVTWAVIFLKWRYFHKIEKGLLSLLALAEKSKDTKDLVYKLKGYKGTSGWRLATGLLKEVAQLKTEGILSPHFHITPLWVDVFIQRLTRRLQILTQREYFRARKYLSFLAIAGNSSPFIGLFGTVWGIMASFHHIGLKGSASLATVAPGIAEALVATALGLFAAIPAAIAYNFFTSRLYKVENSFQELGKLILLLVEKDFLREISKSAKQ